MNGRRSSSVLSVVKLFTLLAAGLMVLVVARSLSAQNLQTNTGPAVIKENTVVLLDARGIGSEFAQPDFLVGGDLIAAPNSEMALSSALFFRQADGELGIFWTLLVFAALLLLLILRIVSRRRPDEM